MRRFRISTPLLLVVVVALVVERLRSTRLMAEMQAERGSAREAALVGNYHEQVVRVVAANEQAAKAAAPGAEAAGKSSR